MAKRSALLALPFLVFTLIAGRALAACTVGTIAELPVTMSALRPTVPAKVNGANALFIADSGAFFSLITPASAAEFGLKLRPAPVNLRVEGIGGGAQVSETTVKVFSFAGVPYRNVEFLVGGSESGNDAAGVLGQNVLGMADVEYDLANGTIRLMTPKNCDGWALAYWARSDPISTLDIAPSRNPRIPSTTTSALVNGVKIRVVFDTGAAISILSLAAGRRAGIDPKGAGVTPVGFTSGIGRRVMATWIAPVASFKIGEEEIRNTQLRLGDISLDNADMLIGADFFLSHRIYVANSQRKLYFTYNGGSVFNLGSKALTQAGAASPTPSIATPDGAPADAAGFARRGAAFAARREFEQAIADLNRACEMSPKEPQYFYQRGVAHLGNKQPFLAMADFDKTLELKPDAVPALLARAELRLAGRDNADAIGDLDAADRAAEKESDLRLAIAELYLRADSLPSAITQFDLWIEAHPQDSRQAPALNGRCWARALLGKDLDKALADCGAALRMTPKSAAALDGRGLVRLRQGDLNKSIADFDAALSLQPKNAWSLYGRGLARLREGITAEGKADIAAATTIRPLLPDEARKHGIAP